MWKITMQFRLRFCWVGVGWSKYVKPMVGNEQEVTKIMVCLLPTLPIILTITRRLPRTRLRLKR